MNEFQHGSPINRGWRVIVGETSSNNQHIHEQPRLWVNRPHSSSQTTRAVFFSRTDHLPSANRPLKQSIKFAFSEFILSKNPFINLSLSFNFSFIRKWFCKFKYTLIIYSKNRTHSIIHLHELTNEAHPNIWSKLIKNQP